MPHAVFRTGSQTAAADTAARTLIPGIEPGGSRAGKATKPALLIRNMDTQLQNLTPSSTDDTAVYNIYLKLSQELDLTPGLLLHVATFYHGSTLSAVLGPPVMDQAPGRSVEGTVWAPRVVGLRVVRQAGSDTNWSFLVNLDYEQIDVPWMDWFIMWEFIDGIVDNDDEW